MTVGQLIGRFRQLAAYDLDPFVGLDASDADVASILDEAAIELGTAAYLTDPGVTLALRAGQATYPLDGGAFSRRVVEPFSVIVGGRRLLAASGAAFGLWTPAELTAAFPNWPNDPPGTPSRATFLGDRLVLHPAPDQDGTAIVEAQVLPARIDAALPCATPELPLRLHPGIAQRALYGACAINAQESAQFKRLSDATAEAMAVAESIGSRNRAARMGAQTTWSGTESDFLAL